MSTPLTISTIGERLRTQDNRMTQNPMFCLQILVRNVGYDTCYSDRHCWHNWETLDTIYDDDPGFKHQPQGSKWDEFGYVDRWETVMVAFTEAGLKEYMDMNGHNVKGRAFRGETRIYVESFHRCPEMIAIRELLRAGDQSGNVTSTSRHS